MPPSRHDEDPPYDTNSPGMTWLSLRSSSYRHWPWMPRHSWCECFQKVLGTWVRPLPLVCAKKERSTHLSRRSHTFLTLSFLLHSVYNPHLSSPNHTHPSPLRPTLASYHPPQCFVVRGSRNGLLSPPPNIPPLLYSTLLTTRLLPFSPSVAAWGARTGWILAVSLLAQFFPLHAPALP